MNTELITLRECKNNGKYIHLYHNNDTNVWIAYGYSAYALWLEVKSKKYDSLQSFSRSFQMPCTLVSESAIQPLRSTGETLAEIVGSYVHLEMPTKIDTTDYLSWASKLREASCR